MKRSTDEGDTNDGEGSEHEGGSCARSHLRESLLGQALRTMPRPGAGVLRTARALSARRRGSGVDRIEPSRLIECDFAFGEDATEGVALVEIPLVVGDFEVGQVLFQAVDGFAVELEVPEAQGLEVRQAFQGDEVLDVGVGEVEAVEMLTGKQRLDALDVGERDVQRFEVGQVGQVR